MRPRYVHGHGVVCPLPAVIPLTGMGTVLNQLKSRGIAATGITGDESPMTAFADAIDQFDPDHILIALRSSEHRGWQEHRLIDHIVERFRIPVTVFTMEP